MNIVALSGRAVKDIELRFTANGKGVANGMVICNSCHEKLHKENDLLEKWQEIFRQEYGDDFYKDEWD